MGFSSQKSNLYTAISNLVALPLFWVIGWHSDWTRERMWHYVIPALISIPGFAVWTHVSLHPEVRGAGISAISLYGMTFLAQMVRIAQPVIMSYRSSTLYGATEQSTGGAAVVAALSIASILGPQVRLFSSPLWPFTYAENRCILTKTHLVTAMDSWQHASFLQSVSLVIYLFLCGCNLRQNSGKRRLGMLCHYRQ